MIRLITTFDVVELRKLILGIYDELPNNKSWRFVDRAYTFPNPSNPFASAFPESKTVANMLASQMGENFVGVKIGDVNGTAAANNLMKVDDRTTGTVLFDVEERAVKAGETFEVKFRSADRVPGYQFTLAHAGLEVLAITDSPFSPLASIAQTWFEVQEANFEGFRSMAATLTLAMTLTVATAERAVA